MKSREKSSSSNQVFEIVDFENLDATAPERAVKVFKFESKPGLRKSDLLIIGGGTGGVAAAIAACSAGLSVSLVEMTSWLGGQITSQGVSALDENYLVETTGATRSYQAFRQAVRDHYKSLGATDGGARFEKILDPGNCWVSRLAFEPKVGVKVISQMLQGYLASGLLKIYLRSVAVSVRVQEQSISSVQCVDLDSGKFTEFRCRFCIDATELGDLLALAKLDYRSGAESSAETGERHAPEKANPDNVQDFTYTFAVEFCSGQKHLIPKPPHYDEFKAQNKFTLQNYRFFENAYTKNGNGESVELLPFWEYRRLIARENFDAKIFPFDIAMINWESNDLRGENIIDVSPLQQSQRLALGKNLSLGFLYWMQNELERDDGGTGYPELKLRPDIMDTADGLSKYPYIRESRRIVAVRNVVESDLLPAPGAEPLARARWCSDSLGIGLYPIDIHGTQDVPGAAQATLPFQVAASALVQKKIRNLLPAAKNIGVTHISNGAYRLHPIEWAIGEAAGSFAVEAIKQRTDVKRLLKNRRALRKLQKRLLDLGSPLVWFDDISPGDPGFAAAQYLALTSIMPVAMDNLHFRPEEAMQMAELSTALNRLLGLQCEQVRGLKPVTVGDIQELISQMVFRSRVHSIRGIRLFFKDRSAEEQVSRREFALWMYQIIQNERFFGRH